MKKFLLTFLIACNLLFSQAPGKKPSGSFEGGFGFTNIGDKNYYQVAIAPEFAFGKFGIGLDLNILVDVEDNSIRWSEMQKGRFLRYLRWGLKGDDLYVRLGMLDYARLGNGTIMYLYKNSPDVSDRKIGMEFDYNFGKFGLESMYSDFAHSGVVGLRGYVKPLQLAGTPKIPIIGDLEVGSTLVTDLRNGSGGIKNDSLGSIEIMGFDVSMPLTKFPVFSTRVYTDLNKIVNFGSGMASGIDINSTFPGLSTFIKVERRYANTERYLPNYFDAFYEAQWQQKSYILDTTKNTSPGTFGMLSMNILGSLNIAGSYAKLDDVPKSGKLHLETSTGNILPMITINAGYDRVNISGASDIFGLDERSLLYASGGYMLNSFTRIDLTYYWTFKLDPATGIYKTEKRIQPKISLVFPFGG